MERVSCALCDLDDCNLILRVKDYRFHLSTDIFNLMQCNRCGLIYLDPRPTKKEMSEFYPQDYYRPKNLSGRIIRPYSILMEKMKAVEISKYKKCGRILDVGCGAGDFLSVFDCRKWERFGVDISDKACKIANKNLNNNIFCGELIDCMFPNKYFDVVALNQVLEHMMNPIEETKEIFRILKDDGVLFIRVPNMDTLQLKLTKEFWLHLDVPRHTYFYSEKTLKLLLDKNGFKIIKTSYPLFEYPFDFFHSFNRKYTSNNDSKRWSIPLYVFALFTFLAKISPRMRGIIQLITQKR